MLRTGVVALLLAPLTLQVVGELATASPLGKALELIQNLQQHVKADGVKQEEAYKKYKDWCAVQTSELLRELETEKKASEKLEAEIYEAEADLATAGAEVEKFASQVARADAKLTSAKKLREQERQSFQKSESSLTQSIGLLDKAGEVLAKGQEDAKAKGAGLLQQTSSSEATRVSDTLLALAALVDSAGFAAHRQAQLTALAMEEEDGAPGEGAYQSRSGDLVELLKQMQDEAETNLADLRKSEEAGAHTFQLLAASLQRQLDDDQRSLATAQAARKVAETRKAKLHSDRTGAGSGSSKVEDALKTTQDACMQAAADEEASEQGRRAEMEILADAVRIIGGVAQGNSFLQLASSTRLRASEASKKSVKRHEGPETEAPQDAQVGRVVVGLLGRLAKQQQLPILAQLAGKVSAAFQSSDDPLAAARKMVQDLILKMQDQITSEAQEHGYCQTEISRSETRIKSLKMTIRTAQTEIEQASSSAAVLGAGIDEAREALAALSKEQVGLTGSLDTLRQSMESSRDDLQQGLDAIRLVMDKLKTYYGSQQSSLLQTGSGEGAQADEPSVESTHREKEVALMAESMGMDAPLPEDAAPAEAAPEPQAEDSLAERAANAIAALQQSAVTAAAPPPPRSHVASLDAGNSIIHVLETCESEVAKSLAQLDTQAGDQSSQQRELLQQNQILQKQKELDVERKSREAKAADAEARRLKEDLEAAKSELEPLQEYYAQVKQRCSKKVTREDIMRRRKREIEGLKEALAVLEGQASLVQLRKRRAVSFLQRRMQQD